MVKGKVQKRKEVPVRNRFDTMEIINFIIFSFIYAVAIGALYFYADSKYPDPVFIFGIGVDWSTTVKAFGSAVFGIIFLIWNVRTQNRLRT